MKLIHLSDLHLGKRVNEFSMLEDQAYILKKILNIIDDEAPDGVIIAGDVYDKSVPSSEAVELFDDFLVRLAGRKLEVFVISGNHDSPERIAFGGRLMDISGVHMSPVYGGSVTPISLRDSYGDLSVYMLPFVKPANVRRFFPDDDIASYTDAVRVAVEQMSIDQSRRNIIVTHQFVTGSTRCESEDITVGGADNVDAAVFDGFDYVALGHIHSPQSCSKPEIRYCGTPLKYSFSEAKDDKSVTIVELFEKGAVSVRTVPLEPKREMREFRGTYEALTIKSFYENTTYQDDYVHITLTDEDDIPDAVGKLRVIYRGLMKLDYDNRRTRCGGEIAAVGDVETKSPIQLFAEFFEIQNNQPMNDRQLDFMSRLIERVWEAEQ